MQNTHLNYFNNIYKIKTNKQEIAEYFIIQYFDGFYYALPTCEE